MKKSHKYDNKYFDHKTLRKLLLDFRALADPDPRNHTLTIRKGATTWNYDDIEEFFEDYKREPDVALLSIYGKITKGDSTVDFDLGIAYYNQDYKNAGFEVTLLAPDRKTISPFFEFLDEAALTALDFGTSVQRAQPIIFIGHGRSGAWRDLKDHLTDKHHYKVEAYESGARAGHTIRDILDDMMSKSTFALLIMTAEDEMGDGAMRARQNVIHETGLFQGKLGFSRAIVVLEEGTEEFSNIAGVQQIRYSKGNIKEIFGEVLATLRREFP